MSIQQALQQLDKSSLVQLVTQLHRRYEDIDQTIERHSARTSTAENTLYTVIQRQMQQINQDLSFIKYNQSSNFANGLEHLLMDINTLLRGASPDQALQATENFIWLHESIMQRVDDSMASVSMVFEEAIVQWLDIATEVRSLHPQAQNWVNKVLAFYNRNDYGVLGDVISYSGALLSSDELTQLAWRFEAEAKQALEQQRKSKDTRHKHEVPEASHGLRAVAKAKGDIALFEKSYLLTSPQPSTAQMERIITFAITIKHFERAKYWLAQAEWQQDPYRFKTLRNQLLEAQGNSQKLKQHLSDDFYQNPSENTLQSYWEVADKTEKDRLTKQIPELISSAHPPPPDDAIGMALIIQHCHLAEKLLIKHGHQLASPHYGKFLYWLEQLDEKSHPLACIVCYRCLLSDLLEQGYAKAYHHGADYFHNLLRLDKKVTDYKGLQNAQQYIRSLQEIHWRKRSFWQQADYPNKPS